MKVNLDHSVSILEASENFSKLTRLVDENGAAVILKNNKPNYVLVEYNELENEQYALDSEVKEAANNVLSKYLKTFEKLA